MKYPENAPTTNGTFVPAEELGDTYRDVVETFIKAFEGEPWYEVSTCADKEQPQRCPGGLSSVAVGSVCETCDLSPSKPAYDIDEQIAKFERHAETYPTLWYMERVGGKLAMAGFANHQDHRTLLDTVYDGDEQMGEWLQKNLGDGSVVWLHELFADRTVRPTGNLRQFEAMCTGFLHELGASTLAYCTINPRMIAAAQRSFGDQVTVYEPHTDSPDWRYVVQIDVI